MKHELKEKIAKNAASGWFRCFKCDKTVRDIDEYPYPCEKEKFKTCSQWYNGYRTALLALGDDRLFSELWKPADSNDLPEIDREVIALLEDGKVVFAHRPPEYWDGKDIITGKVTRNYPKTYDTGEWNQPNVKWWLDLDLPK